MMSNHSSTKWKLLSRTVPLRTLLNQVQEQFRPLGYRPGIHTGIHLAAGGFTYTGDGDTARCDACGLEVSNWTVDMVPFTVHSERRPSCPYVCFMKTTPFSLTATIRSTSMLNEQQNTTERRSIESMESDRSLNRFSEPDLLQQVRRRSFSHWPHLIKPSSAQMVTAGFFNTNFEDRVICIYCNLICQQWTPDGVDPSEVHRTLRPHCIFAKALLTRQGSIIIVNGDGNSMNAAAARPLSTSNNINSLQISPFVHRENRTNESSGDQSSYINHYIQRTYFNTDKKTIVVCHYCRRAFRNLDSDENAIIDHCRQSPHCSYARNLCGEELYRQIHGSNAVQQGYANASNAILFMDNGQLVRLDENVLSRLVAARLELPVSQNLLNRGYRLRIIKKCFEDQLRFKGEDFVTDCDLKVACLLLQKQEKHIRGQTGITIPSVSMQQWREHEAAAHAAIIARIRAARELTSTSTEPINMCIVCLVERRVLAFLPCGHLATCVPCGYSFNSCPVCRRRKEASFAVYM